MQGKGELRKTALDIVTTLREPLPLTLAFVAHHLEQGVRCLHLYFDDPDDAAIGLLSTLRQVRVTACDAAYWSRHGGRPAMIVARQTANAQDAQRHARSPWLLHCDADEFLIQTRYILRVLGAADDDLSVLRLRVWERCFAPLDPSPGVFGGICRGPVLAPAAVYGSLSSELTRGMAAYAGCKSITRVGAGLAIGIHDSARMNGAAARQRPVRRRMLHLPQIVHFDGLTPAHAAAKLIDRGHDIPVARRPAIMSPARSAQITALAAGTVEPVTYFRRLRGLTPAAYQALLAQGAVMPMPVNPAAAAARRWPQTAVLFQPEVFDRVMGDQIAGRWRISA